MASPQAWAAGPTPVAHGDPATSDIRAEEFTPSPDGDGPVLPYLLGQVPEDEQIGTVTVDGAYDARTPFGPLVRGLQVSNDLPFCFLS